MQKDEIFETLKGIMVDLFEVDPADVQLSTHLYDGLDIDSIDALDLMVKLRELTGKRIKLKVYAKIRTVEDVVNVVADLLDEADG